MLFAMQGQEVAAAQIAAFRRFNRMYTHRIGTLGEGLLQTQHTLSEARVLYELAHRNEPQASEICDVLDMDAGYLSRILSKFVRLGLVQRARSVEDSRAYRLKLTERGVEEAQHLSRASDAQAQGLLVQLSVESRSHLIQSMQQIERILRGEGATEHTVALRPHRAGDMGLVVQREAQVYAQEYGWDSSFESLVARIVADFLDHFCPGREACWIAEVEQEHAGHIFLVQHPEEPQTAKLRLLMVEKKARGLGIGRKLVAECLQFARQAGYQKVVLWTQSNLTSAHRIYQEAGFSLTQEEPHVSFGKKLIGQTWELVLVKPSAIKD